MGSLSPSSGGEENVSIHTTDKSPFLVRSYALEDIVAWKKTKTSLLSWVIYITCTYHVMWGVGEWNVKLYGNYGMKRGPENGIIKHLEICQVLVPAFSCNRVRCHGIITAFCKLKTGAINIWDWLNKWLNKKQVKTDPRNPFKDHKATSNKQKIKVNIK